MTTKVPKVTVLMPVYNGEQYLAEAIGSILSQTYMDFELLVINDGSKDSSVEIIESYNDSRIRLVNNEENLGIILTLNKGLDLARGEYIARMDADDISLPERLEKQVAFMDENVDVGVCGTWFEMFSNAGLKIIKHPTSFEEIKAQLFFETAFAHPTVILRKSLFDKYKLRYEMRFKHAEDYGLWVQCASYFPMANLGEVLLKYRLVSTSISHVYHQEQFNTVFEINKQCLSNLNMLNKQESDLHKQFLFYSGLLRSRSKISNILKWIYILYGRNNEINYYSKKYFTQQLANRWLIFCYNHIGCGPLAGWYARQLSFFSENTMSVYFFIKFAVKSFIKW